MTDTTVSATADVTTDAPARYAKQLASHLGRKLTVEQQGEGRQRLVFEQLSSECLLIEQDGVLRMEASAPDAESLERVKDVVGRHLERFGEKAGLTVVWSA